MRGHWSFSILSGAEIKAFFVRSRKWVTRPFTSIHERVLTRNMFTFLP